MSFARAVAHVLKMEGGLVDNPADPGGRTNRGITQRYLDAARASHPELSLPEKVDDVTDEIATTLYSVNEWTQIEGDLLPDPVSFALLDFAVNSGAVEAVRCLQRGLNLPVDGIMGPQTIAACSKSGSVTSLSVQRLLFMASLKTWPTFRHDWAYRVIDTAIEAFQ